MKRLWVLFSIFLALTTSSDSSVHADEPRSLKVLWWNIHWGKPSDSYDESLFNHSIQDIIGQVNSPDVVVLAEYRPLAFHSDTFEQFIRQYPYSQQANYGNSNSDTGIILWSKYPFQVDAVQWLDFTPPNATELEKEAYRKKFCPDQNCARPYLQVSLSPPGLGGKRYTVIATHINDFWRNYSSQGVVKTLVEIASGTHNPVWNQIAAFRAVIEQKLGHDLKTSPVVVVGDFNMPKRIPFTPILTRGYRKMSWDLKDAMPDHFTFPSAESEEAKVLPKVAIDHAFVSNAVEVLGSSVLEDSGSHHYPLSLEVR